MAMKRVVERIIALLILCTPSESFGIRSIRSCVRRTKFYAETSPETSSSKLHPQRQRQRQQQQRQQQQQQPPQSQRRPKYFSSSYVRDPRDHFLEDRTDETLHALLEERAKARREQNWKRADEIQEQLLEGHNIQVYDGQKHRIYSRRNSMPLIVLKDRYEKVYGPTCHPYTHVGPQTLDRLTCPLTKSDVHNILCRRVWLKSEKRFFEADAQLYELMTYRIEINDALKQWRTDGKVLFQSEWSKPPKQALTYKEITSLSLLERTRIRIQQLVYQRAFALARDDEHLAHALQSELYHTYQVTVDDLTLTWQVGGNFNMESSSSSSPSSVSSFDPTTPCTTVSTSHLPTMVSLDPEHNWVMGAPYRYHDMVTSSPDKQPQPSPLSPHQEARVIQLLMIRDELRSISRFAEADAIALELWSTYAVDTQDTKRQYSVGQKFEPFMSVEQQQAQSQAQSSNQDPISDSIQTLSNNNNNKQRKNGDMDDYHDHNHDGTNVPSWWNIYEQSGIACKLHPQKVSEVENLIKYLSTQQERNPNIVDRLMVRLEEEYGLVFHGNAWNVKEQIQRYRPDTKLFLLSSSSDIDYDNNMAKIQDLVDKRNEEMFSHKNKSMAELLEAGLRSKYQIAIDDETQTWYPIS